MKERNRNFAILLSIMMVFTYMPGLAYAAGDEPEPGVLSAAVPEMVVPDAQVAGNDELLEQYFNSEVDKALGSSVQQRSLKSLKSPRKDRLNSIEQYIYDQILAKMQAVASGDDSRAVVEINLRNQLEEMGCLVEDGRYSNCPWAITKESLGLQTDTEIYIPYEDEDDEGVIHIRWGFSKEAKEKLFDTRKIIDAVLLDQPYYAYWFDMTKFEWLFNSLLVTSGTGSDAFFEDDPTLNLLLTVAEDYRADSGDKYDIDTEKTRAAAAAVESVEDIVASNKGKSDLEKLYAYKDKICDLTSYNYAAVDDDMPMPYGDPWQLIYVFDGDEKTNVVCEGYSKAFQFLCDKTTFSSREIDCNTITGDMREKDGTGGGHMWNTLHMDDGRNYIADITNCDADDPRAGYPDFLFLKGYTSGSVEDGYLYDDKLYYLYDSEAFAQYDYEELEMSADDYVEKSVVVENISFVRDGYSEDKPIELEQGGDYSYAEGGVYKYVCPFENGDRLIVNKGTDNEAVYEFIRAHTGTIAEELFVNTDDPDDVLEIPEDVSWDSGQSEGVNWRPGDIEEFKLTYMGATCSIYVKIVKKPVEPHDCVGGHTWGDAVYVWNDDYTEVTGTRSCTACGESVKAVAKRAGSKVTKAPTALGKGEIVYTSEEFTEEGFEAQTIRAAIPALVDTDPILRTFTGIPDSKIKKVKGLKKSKETRTAITVKWTKLSKKNLGGATKYEIWACPNKGFKRTETKVATVSKSKSSGKVKGLRKNTKYFVKVRAIRYAGGVKYVGPWSSAKGIKTKK